VEVILKNSLDWLNLCEIDDLSESDNFVKTVLPPNATRDSTKPYCIFYNKLEELKHRMQEQIRIRPYKKSN
jgi:hypothetical protein